MAASAARSFFRSSSLRSAASRVSSATAGAGAARPSLRSLRPSAATRFLRSPVEASFCVESLMPMHTATASALMTSMLSVSRRGDVWLSEAGNDDV